MRKKSQPNKQQQNNEETAKEIENVIWQVVLCSILLIEKTKKKATKYNKRKFIGRERRNKKKKSFGRNIATLFAFEFVRTNRWQFWKSFLFFSFAFACCSRISACQ